MTIIENNNIEELVNLKNFDRVKATGSVTGWEKQVYIAITGWGSKYLDTVINRAYKAIPDDASPEDIKTAMRVAFLDYIEGLF